MIDIGLIALCILLVVGFIYIMEQRDKTFDVERQQWSIERQQLLDRVQAPSFDHLKQAEVRLERVRQTKEPSSNNLFELL